MSALRGRVAATTTWTLLLLLAAAVIVLALAYDSSGDGIGFAGFAVPLCGMAVTTATVGFAIRLRRPGNRIGWLMALGPLLMLSGFGGYATGAYRAQVAGFDDVIGGLAATWGAAVVLPGIFLTYPAVVILFPDGRLPGPRWRLVVGPILAMLAASSLLALVTPTTSPDVLPANPLAIPGLPEELGSLAGSLGSLGLVISVFVAAAAVVVRFRRSTGAERQQLKWLVASGTLAAATFPVSFFTDAGPGALIDLLSLIAVTLIPVAIGVAILRYRLFEIDRIVSRTVGWAIVTGILVVMFAGLVVGLQALLSGVTQGQTLAVAASTLVAFALFQPVRRRVQHAVDRRFDRARYDGQATADSFARRLRAETDISVVTVDLSSTAAAAVVPASLAIWLRPRGARR